MACGHVYHDERLNSWSAAKDMPVGMLPRALCKHLAKDLPPQDIESSPTGDELENFAPPGGEITPVASAHAQVSPTMGPPPAASGEPEQSDAEDGVASEEIVVLAKSKAKGKSKAKSKSKSRARPDPVVARGKAKAKANPTAKTKAKAKAKAMASTAGGHEPEDEISEAPDDVVGATGASSKAKAKPKSKATAKAAAAAAAAAEESPSLNDTAMDGPPGSNALVAQSANKVFTLWMTWLPRVFRPSIAARGSAAEHRSECSHFLRLSRCVGGRPLRLQCWWLGRRLASQVTYNP